MNDGETEDPQQSAEPPHGDHEDDSLFDRVVPENLKRRIEAGVENVLKDRRVKHFVEEFKLPRELITHAKAQMDDTKRAAVEIIARETREFLEQTNLADELAKLLTQVSLQVEVRFIPNRRATKDKQGSGTERKGIFTRFRSSPPPQPEPDAPSQADDAEPGTDDESAS